MLGNHDAEHERKVLNFAFDEVAACLSLHYKGGDIFVSHYPVTESVMPSGSINLHGHLHNTVFPPALGDGRRHASMCVEMIAYTPRTLDELLEGI